MEQTKQRDYMFDAFRGLLMCSIPLSHFTRVAGHFSAASLSGIIYITINVFVMQAFVFLSGYFSKKPDRARQSAFHTFLWPYLILIPFFYVVRLVIWGHSSIDLLIPPFALWYLFALFFYRFFLKDYIKIPHIFEIVMVIYLLTGMIPFFSDIFALGRMFSYFPFFLLGYYCTPEHLKKLRSLKKWHCGILAIVLIGMSCLLAFCGDQFPVGYYLLKSPCCELGMAWYWDIIGRMMIFVLACGWIILMINILPNKKNYLTYIGMNTMPIYILHLIVRYLVKKYGITFGIFPDNVIVYYVLIFGLAILCSVVLSSKPVAKAYDFVIEGTYTIFMWLLHKFTILMAIVHKPVSAFANFMVELIYLAGGTEDSRKHKRDLRIEKRNKKREALTQNNSDGGIEHETETESDIITNEDKLKASQNSESEKESANMKNTDSGGFEEKESIDFSDNEKTDTSETENENPEQNNTSKSDDNLNPAVAEE